MGSPTAQTPAEGLPAWLAVVQAQSVVTDLLEHRLQADAGIPLGFFEVLFHLAGKEEGKLRMNDLARSLVVSKSGVTRLVDRMEAGGFVVRSSCATDRRVTYAEITTNGRDALARALPVHNRAVEEFFSRHLGATDRNALQSALRKVLDANGAAAAPCLSVADVKPQLRKKAANR